MKTNVLAALLLSAAVSPCAYADDTGRLTDLEKKIEILSGEIERIKLGSTDTEPAELSSQLGFGPAASKIYQKSEKRVSFGGYGESLYEDFEKRKEDGTGSGKTDKADFLRAVLYVGYKFNNWITLNSEFEFEHASTGGSGEVGAEMVQLDFAPWGKVFGFRTGLLLMPVGLVNEVHEPTTFHGAKRPSIETNIYPTTWRENGAGVFGEIGMFSYRSYLVAGLQASNAAGTSGFSASSGLRGGRTKGSNSPAGDFAWVGRLDAAPIEGTLIGASFYTGQADHQVQTLASVPVTLWDVHAKAEYKGAEIRGLYTEGRIGNVDSLNIRRGIALGSASSIGSKMFGGYFEAAYDVFHEFDMKGHYLAPFFLYERYDTQMDVPDGWTESGANSRREYTFGLTYKPIAQVVVKFDHQVLRNQASTGVGQNNFAVGYIF